MGVRRRAAQVHVAHLGGRYRRHAEGLRRRGSRSSPAAAATTGAPASSVVIPILQQAGKGRRRRARAPPPGPSHRLEVRRAALPLGLAVVSVQLLVGVPPSRGCRSRRRIAIVVAVVLDARDGYRAERDGLDGRDAGTGAGTGTAQRCARSALVELLLGRARRAGGRSVSGGRPRPSPSQPLQEDVPHHSTGHLVGVGVGIVVAADVGVGIRTRGPTSTSASASTSSCAGGSSVHRQRCHPPLHQRDQLRILRQRRHDGIQGGRVGGGTSSSSSAGIICRAAWSRDRGNGSSSSVDGLLLARGGRRRMIRRRLSPRLHCRCGGGGGGSILGTRPSAITGRSRR